MVPSASGAASALLTRRCWSIRARPENRGLTIVTWKWSPPPVRSITDSSVESGNACSSSVRMVSLAIGDDASDALRPYRGAGVRYETVQEGFRSFVARTLEDEGRAWLDELPRVVAELEQRWRLTLDGELQGGLLSCVFAATTMDGRRAVLKIGAYPRTHHEIASLRAWGGRGAPELLEADTELQALLLERIEPGTHPDEGQAEEVASVLEALHISPPPGLPTLDSVVSRRIENAERDGRASRKKAEWARAAATQLALDPPGAVLVHGDFDDRNLLVCARRGLCAIDPLPCVGDPAYDAGYWAHANRRRGRRARLDAIVASTGLDRERVRDWAAVVGVHG
jgi:streptomycin 6-kinase